MNRFKGAPGFTIVELLIVVVVIAILAAITIVSYNGITSQARASVMASDLSSFKKKSELHKAQNDIACPDNYVFIFGNSAYGTSDFCVMKYEARNVGGVATSQPGGLPWVNITQVNSIAVAAAACSGCRLITDAEWMTIAADVMSVKYNWSGNEVGKGFIYSGHNDSTPASSLAASTDDDGYFGTGNSATSGANQRRTLYLTSGDVIWDLAGNANEQTSDVITGNLPGVPGQSTWAWTEYDNPSLLWGSLPAASRPLVGMLYPASKGVGSIYSNPPHQTARSFLRGGSWGAGVNAGVAMLYLGEPLTSVGDRTGFRVAR